MLGCASALILLCSSPGRVTYRGGTSITFVVTWTSMLGSIATRNRSRLALRLHNYIGWCCCDCCFWWWWWWLRWWWWWWWWWWCWRWWWWGQCHVNCSCVLWYINVYKCGHQEASCHIMSSWWLWRQWTRRINTAGSLRIKGYLDAGLLEKTVSLRHKDTQN